MGKIRHQAISFIIPTLWRPDTTLELLQFLEHSKDVLEIIIIDNAPSHRPNLPEITKLHLVEQDSNCYVNPAWNLGVEIAQSNLICLCNDDILFADNLLPFIRHVQIKGIIGLHPSSYLTPLEHTSQPAASKEVLITKNWGSLLFFERKRYVPIPEDMKIWWGDAWLAQKMKPARAIKTAVSTPHSVSAGSPEFQEITKEDSRLWNEEYRMRPSWIKRTAAAVYSFQRKLR